MTRPPHAHRGIRHRCCGSGVSTGRHRARGSCRETRRGRDGHLLRLADALRCGPGLRARLRSSGASWGHPSLPGGSRGGRRYGFPAWNRSRTACARTSSRSSGRSSVAWRPSCSWASVFFWVVLECAGQNPRQVVASLRNLWASGSTASTRTVPYRAIRRGVHRRDRCSSHQAEPAHRTYKPIRASARCSEPTGRVYTDAA